VRDVFAEHRRASGQPCKQREPQGSPSWTTCTQGVARLVMADRSSVTFTEQIPRGSFKAVPSLAAPSQRCVTSARGTIWFCTCGRRVAMESSKSKNWETVFENAVEQHEWDMHGVA
jgi:hypothetical protein